MTPHTLIRQRVCRSRVNIPRLRLFYSIVCLDVVTEMLVISRGKQSCNPYSLPLLSILKGSVFNDREACKVLGILGANAHAEQAGGGLHYKTARSQKQELAPCLYR